MSQALLQVAEKIQAKLSAGVDAARSRLADRNLRRSESDTKDRKAARTLLESSKKKRRRKSQKKRVYEQNWFQAIGLASLLAIVATLVYVAFRFPPNAKKLFDQALTSMESGDWDTKLQAREGPIKTYLDNFPDSDTVEGKQMRDWAEEVDRKQRERSLLRRKKAGFAPENDAEKEARDAFDSEAKSRF